MSRFFTSRYDTLVPYVPGEQPKDMVYIKLNTNESPFPPSAGVQKALNGEWDRLQLYSDPECRELRHEMSRVFGVGEDNILMTNGSDEVLNFAFMAFADEKSPLAFADLTYGFYPVFAELNHIPYTEIPLKADFSLDPEDYIGIGKTIVIANPNAPTGMAIPLAELERIIKTNPEHVVIVDEAYVDFGGESAVSLTKQYDNLLVTGTFSKSRSMAGARLGFGIGNEALIADLNTIKYSTNPYNINRCTASAGVAALRENEYYMANCQKIIENREWTRAELSRLGFTVLPSQTNFLFAAADWIDGGVLYTELKARGILVRHFTKERIKAYNRITIGTKAQMEALIAAIACIKKEALP